MNDLMWILLAGSLGGMAAAAVARMILPGKQMISGLEMLVIGTGTGFLGGLIAGVLGLDDNKGWQRLIPFAISVGIAAIAIYLWTDFRNKQIKQALVPDLPGKGKASAGGDTKDKDKDKKKLF